MTSVFTAQPKGRTGIGRGRGTARVGSISAARRYSIVPPRLWKRPAQPSRITWPSPRACNRLPAAAGSYKRAFNPAAAGTPPLRGFPPLRWNFRKPRLELRADARHLLAVRCHLERVGARAPAVFVFALIVRAGALGPTTSPRHLLQDLALDLASPGFPCFAFAGLSGERVRRRVGFRLLVVAVAGAVVRVVHRCS